MNKQIILLGDIHGRIETLMANITKYGIEDSIIIQVGDFGLGFMNIGLETRLLNELDNYLGSKDIILLAIRGNHDNPFYWTEDRLSFYDNIKLVKDYDTMVLNGFKFLFIGGAYSIDRDGRKEGLDYWKGDRYKGLNLFWKEEVLNFKPELLMGLKDIDYVVTHTAPNLVYPFTTTQFDKKHPQVREERNNMSMLFNILNNNNNIKKYFYGHFHESNRKNVFDTEFILLDIDEFYPLM